LHHQYKKGDELEAIVLGVDSERERISLGIKQLDSDAYPDYLAQNPKGSLVTGKITDIDSKRIVVELAQGVEGHIKLSDLARDQRTEEGKTNLKVGDEIESKFMGVDKKNRILNLSVKAKESQEEANALKEYSAANTQASEAQSTGTLADIFKEHLDKDKE